MTWEKIRKLCPNQYVLLREIKYHVEGDNRYIDDVELVSSFNNSIDAVTEMIKLSDKVFVYHTSGKELGFKKIRGEYK